jgi:chemotaxis protein MotC
MIALKHRATYIVAAFALCFGGDCAAGGEVSLKPPAVAEMTRSPAQTPMERRVPVELVTGFARAQLSIAHGDANTFARQAELARNVTHQLSELRGDVWLDRLNRSALIKFVLSGGDPNLLRTVAAKARGLDEPESLLIEATLEFASGRLGSAGRMLEAVDHTALGAALGGHLALVKAITVAQSNAYEAIELCQQAWILSPGTIVEEAALRLAIDLSIEIGDQARFDAAAVRYLYRYPSSIYAYHIIPRIAGVFGALDYLADNGRKHVLAAVTIALSPDREADFFMLAAEGALRTGKFASAELAASRALSVASAGSVTSQRSLGMAAAAAVARNDLALWRRLEVQAEGTRVTDRDASMLLGAARRLGEAITAPPQRPTARQANSAAPATGGRLAQDKFESVLESVKERIADTAALLDRDGS